MCAYFEPEWRPEHIDEMYALGYNAVLFCITEADVTEQSRELKPTIDYARNRGMTCQAELWNFAGVFGGEAPSAFANDENEQACLGNPNFRWLLADGIDRVKDLGFDSIFWDEPNFSNVKNLNPCDCCESHELELIRQVAAYTSKTALHNTVCMTSTDKNYEKLGILASEGHVKGIATDPYYSNFPGDNNDEPPGYVGKWAARLMDLEDFYGTQAQIWVQGFHLPTPDDSKMAWYEEADARPWHEVPLMAAKAALDEGVSSIGFWGFRACCDIPELAPAYPERVWQNTASLTGLVYNQCS